MYINAALKDVSMLLETEKHKSDYKVKVQQDTWTMFEANLDLLFASIHGKC